MFDQVLIDEGKALEDTQSLLSHDNGKDCGDGSRLKMGSGRDEDRDFVFRDEVFRDIELQDDPISHTWSEDCHNSMVGRKYRRHIKVDCDLIP